jgi:hypothetical protein
MIGPLVRKNKMILTVIALMMVIVGLLTTVLLRLVYMAIDGEAPIIVFWVITTLIAIFELSIILGICWYGLRRDNLPN